MRNMKIGRCCLAGLFLWIVQGATAQINYGTTGLIDESSYCRHAA